MYIQARAEHAAQDLTERANILLRKLREVATALPVSFDDEFVKQAAFFLENQLGSQRTHIIGLHARGPRASLGQMDYTATAEMHLSKAMEQNVARFGGAVKLMVAETMRTKQVSVPSVSVSVVGNQNIVQAGVAGNATVIFTAEKVAALREALVGFRKAIEAAPELPTTLRDEMIEVVADADRVLISEQPNQLKLVGYFGTLSIAVQTIAALQPAWEAVKVPLRALGFII
ncbi:MAG: hypothetical protein SFV19_00470 [Rhodospirillaceae bacterium]|nr:hypothetical protein [Rhodospirillaceae bacterium]